MEWIAKAEGLSLERAGTRILEKIDLEVPTGVSIGISGPNGSGKTTLLRALATLIPITSGQLTLFDQQDPVEARRRIGMIGHRPYLVPQLSLAENLHHIGNLSGFEPAKIDQALDVVGLGGAKERRASASSFGMVRRVEIAQQLLSKPDLLLLDEAGSGLDGAAQDLIAELLRLTKGRNGSIVMVSHDRQYLEETCDRVIGLVGGRLEVSP